MKIKLYPKLNLTGFENLSGLKFVTLVIQEIRFLEKNRISKLV